MLPRPRPLTSHTHTLHAPAPDAPRLPPPPLQVRSYPFSYVGMAVALCGQVWALAMLLGGPPDDLYDNGASCTPGEGACCARVPGKAAPPPKATGTKEGAKDSPKESQTAPAPATEVEQVAAEPLCAPPRARAPFPPTRLRALPCAGGGPPQARERE